MIGSNNWRRMHGLPMKQTKRYKHQQKDLPKFIRVKYNTMRMAGCTDQFTKDFILRWHNFEM